jgi:hypothetical protein
MEKQNMVQKTQLEKYEIFAPQLHVLSQSGNISKLFRNVSTYFLFQQNINY